MSFTQMDIKALIQIKYKKGILSNNWNPKSRGVDHDIFKDGHTTLINGWDLITSLLGQ